MKNGFQHTLSYKERKVCTMENPQNTGQRIQETADELMKKGVPPRAAAFAASMGFLRELQKTNRK